MVQKLTSQLFLMTLQAIGKQGSVFKQVSVVKKEKKDIVNNLKNNWVNRLIIEIGGKNLILFMSKFLL